MAMGYALFLKMVLSLAAANARGRGEFQLKTPVERNTSRKGPESFSIGCCLNGLAGIPQRRQF